MEEAQDGSAKEIFKFSELPQRIRINQTSSKEKISNDQIRGKSNSKLPRIVRTPSKFYKPTKSFTKLSTKLDNSGDSLPGPSRLASFPAKMKREELQKFKSSHIPRRKSNKEGFKETWDSGRKNPATTNNQFPQPNIQRVQMLINPEFCPEDRTQTTSVASTRPIPTLGQIYGRINMIDSDRLNDWFMELTTPMNSIASNPRSISFAGPHVDNDSTTNTAPPAVFRKDDLKRSTIVLSRKDNTVHGFKTTNENINVWLSPDVEFPTRDIESGYRTMSIKDAPQQSKQSQSQSQSVESHNTYRVDTALVPSNKTPSAYNPSMECSTGTSSFLKEQQTVVLCRTPDSIKQKVEEGTDISKGNVTLKPSRITRSDVTNKNQTPANVNQSAEPPNNRIPVPSYTECLSEILQKTTNFENIEGWPQTPSSAAVTDGEIRDNLSNEGTLDAMEEFSIIEDQSNPEWCRQQCRSNGNVTFVKSSITVTDWSCKYQSEASETPCSHVSDNHHHHYSWHRHDFSRKYYGENRNSDRDRCKKCYRFKRFPSSRYKLPKTFGTWRQRLSFRRICRRRWNRVWKKTTERWASWSGRNAKFRRFHVMQCLQRSILWEDADVQTNIVTCTEAATGSAMREQKSAAISTAVNMEAWQAMCDKNESVTINKSISNRSRFRHVNLGPSMFPFLYNSKKKSVTLHTVDKGQSGSQFAKPRENPSKLIKTVNENCVHSMNTDRGFSACNSVKSCQYQPVVPENVERSTSLFQAKILDKHTDTEDLPSYMRDKMTSTLLRFSAYRVPKCESKDAYTQKIITCHNAETDVTFLPNLENTSTATITSGCDITYYRPITGSDITHLIAETRTQQALHPILRKFTSSALREQSVEMDTQMSPLSSTNTISTGISTQCPKFTEKTTSYTNGSVLTKNLIENHEIAAQTEETKVISTDTETQITPGSSKNIISTGITPSSPIFGDKTSTFISACVLLGNDAEKEHYAVQTQPTLPNLALTATKIMSISSRQLTHKNTKDKEKDISSTEFLIDKPPLTKTSAALAKSSSKSGDVASCGTETKMCDVYSCNRSTSAKELDTFDTEELLNNLIKKALVCDGRSYHSQYSDRSGARDSNKSCMYTTTCTSTHIGLESKAIGPTLSEVNKLSGNDKADTGIQYVEIHGQPDEPEIDYHRLVMEGHSQMISMCMLNQATSDELTQTEFYDRPAPPLLYKCASVMTSYCGLSEAIQVPPPVANIEDPENKEKPPCACAVMSCNIETNTDYGPLPNLQQPADSPIRTNDTNKTSSVSPKARLQNSLNSQLISLSRLIGKKRPNSTIEPPLTAPIYSSDITADNWISKCSSAEKNYESQMDREVANELQKKATYFLTEPPAILLSKDSLADVLPISKLNDFHTRKQDIKQSTNPQMVDEVTSDDNVTKDVKESILQACPDICETGTESQLQMYQQRSACVLTTQCVLPSPPPCNVNTKHRPATECVFVYGEPRCIVHKRSADAAVQIDPPSDTDVNPKKRDCVNHSVGVFTSFTTMPEYASQRKPSAMIREVLSPKVYKALYETTKLVVSEDSHQTPVRDTTVIAAKVDAEVEAAKFHVPDVRSAGVVTSTAHEFGYHPRCYCKDRGTHAHNKCTLYHVTKPDMAQTSSHFAHAKLLQMPDINKGCFEECMKTHLVTSCRYYSNLLTKQLGRVKENLTKHLAEPIEDNIEITSIPTFTNIEACTMKPSGRTELASQTHKYSRYSKTTKHMPCVLSPAMSLTNICKHDKDHLKSVYYMLSAIEGRLRRLKMSAPPSY